MYRIYVDTSVIGGCFDPEFDADSNRLIDLARQGRLVLLISDVLLKELVDAPECVRNVLDSIPSRSLERVSVDGDVPMLRDAYLRQQIVPDRWRDDATHVAAATVARADAIVSWNFKHIVHLGRMKRYSAVNLANGYGLLAIVTPREVIGEHEDEENI